MITRQYEEGYDLYDPLYQKWLDANNLGSSTLSYILANFEDAHACIESCSSYRYGDYNTFYFFSDQQYSQRCNSYRFAKQLAFKQKQTLQAIVNPKYP